EPRNTTQKTWRTCNFFRAYRSRPTSLGQLARNQYSDLQQHPSGHSNYAFSSTQSELSLHSSRQRGGPSSLPTPRYTAVDIMKLQTGPSSHGCGCCCCCCCCGGGGGGGNGILAGPGGTPGLGQHQAQGGIHQHHGQHHHHHHHTMAPTETQDGPEDLSWRRLHMCRAKLKATATTSELLSGFAMVAMVELQINEPTAVPEWLFVMFAVCTTVLVSVHIFALMISTYLLPNVEAISKLQVARLVSESPHERMRGFIELAWAFSTVLGLFLFLVEVAILCWVKFWDYSFTAATASTVIVIPVLIVFIAFAVHFYHSLVVYKCETSNSDIKELENIKRNLDNAAAMSNSLGNSRV
ncbi:hypothetical protein QAD02_014848, partial [Eretmocerus hayati]